MEPIADRFFNVYCIPVNWFCDPAIWIQGTVANLKGEKRMNITA